MDYVKGRHIRDRLWVVRSAHRDVRSSVETLNGHEVDLVCDVFGVVDLRPHVHNGHHAGQAPGVPSQPSPASPGPSWPTSRTEPSWPGPNPPDPASIGDRTVREVVQCAGTDTGAARRQPGEAGAHHLNPAVWCGSTG